MKLIDGKLRAQTLQKEFSQVVSHLYQRAGRAPHLVTILIGNLGPSSVYVANKKRAAEAIGMKGEIVSFPESISQAELLAEIDRLNADSDIDGMIIQLPLPHHLDKIVVLNRVKPEKDVDGLSFENQGRLLWNQPCLVPCTALAVLDLLDQVLSKDRVKGALAAVIGQSNLVGKPTSLLLERRGATVVGIHSKTKNAASLCKQAEILVVAAGVEKLVGADWVKPGAVVIDVGIHRTQYGLCGDVDFEAVSPFVEAITPVPGGVGPMTVMMLMKNTIDAFKAKYPQV